ncbi:GMC oxidoreductase [Lasiosphaeria miniovina]|uniref:GMC oxidoreductase n=1 Tax=Lasiosphaeria miniovina TaxID=1954250 RepID=A0AA40B4S8_9PEZI|nr:GMC oxidoreductase [Lasiosphaeria miniovina]KAK0727721.1 GMC oxidoreductase [Lasiosphaeria miniovina]
MGLYDKLPDDLQEVDIIIAGGGAAGCVVASRLAAADPKLSILVIEGGTNNYNNPTVTNPMLFGYHLAPTSKTVNVYQAKTAPQLAGRAPVVHTGGILGGGSSVNVAMYTRGQRSDYDSWKTPGWSTDELLPYFKKLETFHGDGDAATHGSSGPIQISDGGFTVGRAKADFLQAAKAVGIAELRDMQDFDASDGMGKWYRYSSPEGKRQDSAHAYLHPLLQDGQHRNLHVLVEHKVLRVLLDEKKQARGVEFTTNPAYQSDAAPTTQRKQTVRARKLVVLSTGSVATPLVLERSGVGRREVLERAGVPLVEELPGVGHDYQDHVLSPTLYVTALGPNETADEIMNGELPAEEAIAKKNKILGWNGIDVAIKMRPTEAEVTALGPEFRAVWERDFKENTNRPPSLVPFFNGNLLPVPTSHALQYITCANFLTYPYSRGHVHITGPELADAPDFDVGFFTDKGDFDLKMQRWSYKKVREVMRRSYFYRGELAGVHPRYPAGSKAACVELDRPLAEVLGGEIKDLVYSAEDDAAIDQLHREISNTTWHSMGTAKMAPRGELGVVDKDLNVYGVQGLKVVDLSIVPKNVAANTYNTALVVGEKGAAIIANELDLTLPL